MEEEKNIKNEEQNLQNNNQDKSPLKNVIIVLTSVLAILEIFLNYVFNLQFEIKVIVEISSIVISSLVVLGVLKTGKNKEDFFKTKKEIENALNENVDKLKKKK